jgi:hypothetical protein
MSNKIIPLPKSYLEKILKPINKLAESCVLKIKDDQLYSITASKDNSLILYSKLKLPIHFEEAVRLNIINVKNFLSGLETLGNNGEFSLILGENYLKCEILQNNEKTFLKYHLVDDSVIKEFPFKIEKVSTLNFDTEFELSSDKAKKILAAASFATETQKVYFGTNEEEQIYADLNDLTLQNINTMNICITNNWKGDKIYRTIPISLEVFKNISSAKANINVKINNEFQVVIFNIQEDNCLELKYIVSALIK